jgi:hypothetical protein
MLGKSLALGCRHLQPGVGSTCDRVAHLLFDLTGAERINYPEIWQCVGMIAGVYRIGSCAIWRLQAHESPDHISFDLN